MASLLAKPCSLLLHKSTHKCFVPFSLGRSSVQSIRKSEGFGARVCPGRVRISVAASSDDGKKVIYNTEFGYSRKDVLIITGGLIALGYGLYYGLRAMGMEAGYAGNWVQLIIFMGICVGWVSTYIFRVATKQMTYVKQLEQYEEAVMRKRVEEMTEAELSDLANEVEADHQRKLAGRAPPKQE